MSVEYDMRKKQTVSAAPRIRCHCRLCLALDAADAFIHDHGVSPIAAARHLARTAPELLNVRAFLAALGERAGRTAARSSRPVRRSRRVHRMSMRSAQAERKRSEVCVE